MDKSKDAIFVNIHVEHGGAAHVTHGPPGSRRHEHAPHATHPATHTWKVAYQGKLYSVTAAAGAMTIVLDGETVWQGERGAHRTYRKQWSKLDPGVEAKVLELARSGDRHVPSAAPPPSASRPSAQRSRTPRNEPPPDPPAKIAATNTTAKKTAAKKPAPKKAAAEQTAPKPALTKTEAPAKKASAKKTAKKTSAEKGTVEVVAHSRSAPGSKRASEQTSAKKTAPKKTAPKKTAPKKTAPKKTAAKQPASKAEQPTTQRSVRPVDDEKVMTELLKGLERDAPQTAAAAYAALRKAWFNGAREAVLAWVKDNPAKKSIAKAYAEWAGANADQVRTMAAKAA